MHHFCLLTFHFYMCAGSCLAHIRERIQVRRTHAYHTHAPVPDAYVFKYARHNDVEYHWDGHTKILYSPVVERTARIALQVSHLGHTETENKANVHDLHLQEFNSWTSMRQRNWLAVSTTVQSCKDVKFTLETLASLVYDFKFID